MAINKIIYGDTTLIDLTNDTIEADTMLSGVTAHGANGEQIYGTMSQVTPATETPLMDGTAAVGTSIKYAREDHVHPRDSSIPTKISDLTNDSGFIAAPSANVDEVLAYNGTTWTADKRMVILSYGSSTWTDFINAYNSNAVVYCRASNNSNPASGAQTRMAFMAYVNSATPTNVEFQYYRSVSSHTDSQQGDQVFIYKLDKTAGWSVTTRNSFTKIVAGTGLSSSYSNGTLTLNNEEDGSVVSVSQTLTSGTEIASVTVDGTETKLYAPTPQNITIDSELSSTSENPVQNKVINSAISEKYTKPNDGIPASDLAAGVIPAPSFGFVYPSMDAPTASVGISDLYAREDHVHPTDVTRQETLVSGENIKTINGESILGSGNIEITGGGTPTGLGDLAYKDSASGSYTPAGTVSQPTITITPTTETVTPITNVGSSSSFTASVSGEVLTLTFTQGTTPTLGTDISVLTSATAALDSAPVFTGTQDTITVS